MDAYLVCTILLCTLSLSSTAGLDESVGPATLSVSFGNETNATTILLSNSTFGEFLLTLLGGDAACTEPQMEAMANCTMLMVEEFSQMDNDTFDNAHETMLRAAKLLSGANQPGPGLQPPELGSFNQSDPFGFFSKHPNESRALLEVTCRGMGKMIDCGTDIIGDTDCNPLMYRVPKAVQGVICEDGFFDLMQQNIDCMTEAAQNEDFRDCMENLNLTAVEVLDEKSSEQMDLTGTICDVTAQYFRCFQIEDSPCSRKVLSITTKLTSRIMEAVFGPGNGCDFYSGSSSSSEEVIGKDVKSDSKSSESSSEETGKTGGNNDVNNEGDKKVGKDDELVRTKRL